MEAARAPRALPLQLRRSLFWLLGALGAFGFGIVFAYSPLIGVALFAALLLSMQAARRLEWAALGLFLLIPMGRLTWLDPSGTLDVTKIVVAAIGIAWGIRCLVKRDPTLVSVWTQSPVSACIIFFFLANLLSLLNTYSITRSALSLIRLSALFVMYALVVALIRTKRDVKIAVGLLLLSGLAVCLIGVWEATTHQYLWLTLGQERDLPTAFAVAAGSGAGIGESEGGPALRIMSVFVDYNFMGGYMAVLLGLVGGAFMAWRRWWLRLLLTGMVGLVLYDTAMTGSRGGLVGVLVAALTLLLLSRIRIRWFILVALIIAAIAIFPTVNQIAPQFRGGISLEDLKRDQRYGYWQMALHMMSDHPIIGVGTDNFFKLYPFYRVSPALMYSYYCHNIYLQMWAEAGTIGLIAILSLVSSVALSYAGALKRTRDETWRSLLVGITAAFAGYAVFSGTCNTLHDQPFWLLMALSVVVLRATVQEEGEAEPADLSLPTALDRQPIGE
jgi:O-antigen ligase